MRMLSPLILAAAVAALALGAVLTRRAVLR